MADEKRKLKHTTAEIDEAVDTVGEHSEQIEELSTDLSGEIARAKAAEEALRKDTFGVPEGRVTTGSDLDTFTNHGAYLCLSSAVGATLINCPVAAGFRLEVKSLAAGAERCVQILYPNISSDVIFYSRRLVSTGWAAWYAVTGTEAPAINTSAVTTASVSETEMEAI